MPFRYERALVWFRRDLRDYDHAALTLAVREARQVYCTFIFDRDILDGLPSLKDRRVQFIHASLLELDDALRQRGGALIVRDGQATCEIPALARELDVQAVFANRDYEPATKRRDARVAEALQAQGVTWSAPKDQALFDRQELLTAQGRPYAVFTPYHRAWVRRLAAEGVSSYDAFGPLAQPPTSGQGVPSLADIGFETSDLGAAGLQPGMSGAEIAWEHFQDQLDRYAETRDFPALAATSGLSPHLRFGTISVRQLVAHAWNEGSRGAETWLKELAWRNFYFQILDHCPWVVERAYKPEYEAIVWDHWPEGLAAWQQGRTGYPLVDAAMRQLAATGAMHNRLRMVTASFLCKHLGIDWRLGERHFAALLNDFDLAANNGGWQWSASTGCDAQPWFRIFNPVTQSEKFDPDGRFIRRHLPELARVPDRHIHAPWRMSAAEQAACGITIGQDYPEPIVEHEKARQRTLARYGVVKNASA